MQPPTRPKSGIDFLDSVLRPWPAPDAKTKLAVVTPSDTRVAIYDNALVALAFDRIGRHDDAGRILEALAALQHPDGAISFSFPIDEALPPTPYVRNGALAWVGYAAVEYLDVAPGGPARDVIARAAHRIASYLLAHQISAHGDPRDGLVTGGEGNIVYEVLDGKIAETFVPGVVEWASVEHNIDTFFFLRDLARVSERPEYAVAADRIRDALLAHAWNKEAGEFRRGLSSKGKDAMLALDCASWGSLFLAATGDHARAETAFLTADQQFASRDPKTGVAGHRPYARGEVLEETAMAEFYAAKGVPADWADLQAVWPEGSAGVALAAARTGHRERAAAILAQLERLRDESGGLPMMSAEIPFEFDTKPSVAATAWVELVRSEIGTEASAPFLWRPPAP